MLQILDCTIRDGGYYTNWDFSNNLIDNYFNLVKKLPIDFVEIGYRNPSVEGSYKGEYFHLDAESIAKCKKNLGDTKLALMLDAKAVKPDEIPELLAGLQKDVDLIRIAVNPHKVDDSIELGRAIVDEGFDLAFNIMYISTGAVTEEVMEKILGCDYSIKYLYLVDSYGGASPEQVKGLIEMIKGRPEVLIGYHGHNNLELALVNTIEAIKAGATIVDATVLGMGRGAGNLKTELLLTYLLGTDQKDCDMQALGDMVDLFKPLYDKFNWGTSLPYMISGAMNIPQGQVMNWIITDRYSENDIIKKVVALGNDNEVSLPDITSEKSIQNKDVLLVGGGSSVENNIHKLKKLLASKDFEVIFASTKFLEDLVSDMDDYTLCISGKQLHDVNKLSTAAQAKIKSVIVHHNTIELDEEELSAMKNKMFKLSNISYPDKNEDSPLLIALEYSSDFAHEVFLIGFDGYKGNTKKGQILNMVNQDIFNHYNNSGMSITSLTSSVYSNNESSIHALTMQL